MSRSRIAGLLAALLLFAAEGAAEERIVRRTFVPTPLRPQGEVRIVTRDGSPVVQVVLWSRILRRVGREIAEKEENSWPDPETPEGDASARYREALDASIGDVLAGTEPEGPPTKVGLLIEVTRGDESGSAAFFAADVMQSAAGFVVVRSDELRRVELPAIYAERNQRLVVADSFEIPETDAAVAIEKAAAARSRPRGQ